MVTPCTQIKTITALETNHINMNKTLDKIIDRLEDMITKDEFIKLENSINLFLDKADNKYADKEKCLELRKAFLWAMGGVIVFMFTTLGTAIFQLILK